MYFSFSFILYLPYFFSEHHSPHTPFSLPLYFLSFSSLSSPLLFLRLLSLVLLFPLLLLLVPDDLYLRHYLRSLYITYPSPSNLFEFCSNYSITFLPAITSSLALPITDFSISFWIASHRAPLMNSSWLNYQVWKGQCIEHPPKHNDYSPNPC